YAGFIEGFQATFATFYGQHGRYSDAIKLFKDALEYPWRDYHSQLPAVIELRSMNNLSVVYLCTKQLSEAHDLLEKTLLAKEQSLGLDSTVTLNTVNNLGNLY